MTKENFPPPERPRGFRAVGAVVCRIARRVDAWADEAVDASPLPHEVARIHNGSYVDNGLSDVERVNVSHMLQTPEAGLAIQAVGNVVAPEGGFENYQDFLEAVSAEYARSLDRVQ